MLVTPWEQPAQFDRGGQLALLLEHGTDRCGLDLGDEPNVAAALATLAMAEQAP